jgi:hypothetical protein
MERHRISAAPGIRRRAMESSLVCRHPDGEWLADRANLIRTLPGAAVVALNIKP